MATSNISYITTDLSSIIWQAKYCYWEKDNPAVPCCLSSQLSVGWLLKYRLQYTTPAWKVLNLVNLLKYRLQYTTPAWKVFNLVNLLKYQLQYTTPAWKVLNLVNLSLIPRLLCSGTWINSISRSRAEEPGNEARSIYWNIAKPTYSNQPHS